jgi:hypothetical protein
MNIDQALRKLCEKHNLTVIGINLNAHGFYSYVHWEGNNCAYGAGDNARSALRAAIANTNALRDQAEVVPTIEIDEVTA